MDSLYGSQPAVSFVLKATFTSEAEMIDAFAQGPSFRDVWYDEYCIIDTPNKNNKENGRIYKRGYDYLSEPMHGAIYIGNIVGPSGPSPYFQMNSIPKTEEKSTIEIDHEYDHRRYPIGKDENGDYIINDYHKDGTPDQEPIASFNFRADGADPVLVPGMHRDDDGKQNFNDDIRYTWCNIRKDNENSDSWFYVGFEIPYLVNDISVEMIPPYDEDGNVMKRMPDAQRIPVLDEDGNEELHPYYDHWLFGIPKGIRGDALRNLRIMVPTEGDKIYDLSAITFAEDGSVIIPADDVPQYDGKDDDVAGQRKILVYDYYFYENKRDGEHVMIYLGDFNTIKTVHVDDDGTLKIEYTHDDAAVQQRLIKWIKDVGLDINNGEFGIKFNNTPNGPDDPKYDLRWFMDWIKNITIAENGDVFFDHTVDTSDVTQRGLIQWVKDVSLADGVLTFIYNTEASAGVNNTKTFNVNWPTQVTVDPTNGNLTIDYFNKTSQTYEGLLKTIESATVDNSGIIRFQWNSGKEDSIKNRGTTVAHHFREIKDVTLAKDLEADKRLTFQFNWYGPDGGNDGQEDALVPVGNPINFIQRTFIDSKDYHLYVLYTDPQSRGTVNGTDSEGRTWKLGSEISVDYFNEKEQRAYWQDLGSMKDQSGVMVGFNLTDEMIAADINASPEVYPEDLLKNAEPIAYLNLKYSNGLTPDATAQPGNQTINGVSGKVITYSPTDKDDSGKPTPKKFYAYDYNKRTWYYLGEIAESNKLDILYEAPGLSQIDHNNLVSKLNNNGILLQGTIYELAFDLPKYWSPEMERSYE